MVFWEGWHQPTATLNVGAYVTGKATDRALKQ